MSEMLVRIDRRLRAAETKLDSLLSLENGIPISNNNVAAPPTDAQLDTAFGDAASLFNGFAGLVDDNGTGTTVWLCVVVNSAWWYEQLTKAT